MRQLSPVLSTQAPISMGRLSVKASATLLLLSQALRVPSRTHTSRGILPVEAHPEEQHSSLEVSWILLLAQTKAVLSEYLRLFADVSVYAYQHVENMRLIRTLGVGFKPTHGLVPYTGVTSGDAIDDHTGPLARSVLDTATCLDAIAGYDGIDDRSLGSGAHGSFQFAKSLESTSNTTQPLSGLKVGILVEGFQQQIVRPKVRDLVLSAAKNFEQLGATVKEVSVPSHLDGPLIWTIQQRVSGAAGVLGQAHGRRGLYLTEFEQARLPWTAENFDKLFPSTKNTVINGLYLSKKFPGLYGKCVNVGRRIRDAYQQAFEEFDIIVMPTTPYAAPRHGSRESPRSCFEPSIGLTTNTAIFNVTGHPAMTMPVGLTQASDDPEVLLPVGMQIVGGLWQEKKILQAGHAWETNFDWKKVISGEGPETSSGAAVEKKLHEADISIDEKSLLKDAVSIDVAVAAK